MATTTEAGYHQAVAPVNSLMPMTQSRLRNSCDACNTAKVKCSKERPCCRRCQRKEQFCVYSVSLRCSKRPIDGRNASIAKRNSASTASTQPTPSIGHGLSLSTGLEGSLDTSLDSASSIPTSLYDLDSLSALSEVNFDLHNLDDYFPTDAYLPPADFYAYSNTTASTPPAQPTLGQKGQNFGDCISSLSRPAVPLCGCQQHILSKLSELSLSSSGHHAPMPFDSALSENRVSNVQRASVLFIQGQPRTQYGVKTCVSRRRLTSRAKAIVALCTSTLDCATCARAEDVTLILTLSALLAHVLQVFESLFRHRREALQPRESGLLGGSPESVSSSVGRGADTSFNMFSGLDLITPPASVQGSRPGTTASSGLNTPRIGSVAPCFGSPIERGPTHTVRLSLGMYELDERDEFILQTSLLKIELSKITSLVGAFEARLCQTKLHHDLVAYLKQSLGANYEALKRLANVHNRGLGRANCIDLL